jgi:alkylation response protein AidB-like acyl-CoA dehydrogenase
VEIVRDVATMEHPEESFGRYGNHAEVLYDNVRVPVDALLEERGSGFPHRPAAALSRAHPLHALARRRASRLRHAL